MDTPFKNTSETENIYSYTQGSQISQSRLVTHDFIFSIEALDFSLKIVLLTIWDPYRLRALYAGVTHDILDLWVLFSVYP